MPVILQTARGEVTPCPSPAATAAAAKKTAGPARPSAAIFRPPPMDKVRPENQSGHTPARILLKDLAHDHGAVLPGIWSRSGAPEQRALLRTMSTPIWSWCTGRVHGIIHAILALIELDFDRPSDADAASKLDEVSTIGRAGQFRKT